MHGQRAHTALQDLQGQLSHWFGSWGLIPDQFAQVPNSAPNVWH